MHVSRLFLRPRLELKAAKIKLFSLWTPKRRHTFGNFRRVKKIYGVNI